MPFISQGKLKLYESWGFPEIWVEVPEHQVASRPRGLVPGLTIRLLEDGAYRVSPESVAFPGWRAEDVHETMNEPAAFGADARDSGAFGPEVGVT